MSRLLELFDSYRGRDVCLLPNTGNAGDGVVAMGFEACCGRYDLIVHQTAPGRVERVGTLFVQGGGNLCRNFHSLLPDILASTPLFERVILLPSSIEPEFGPIGEWLSNLPSHVTICCRELYSFEAVRACVPDPEQVWLEDDLAFHVDVSPWQRAGYGNLNAFRTDAESAGCQLPPDNFDPSAYGDEQDGKFLLDVISDYATVRTDRMHVAIPSARMGKEVHYFAGNYHKARGIYECSLRAFPNVSFHETFDPLYRWVAENAGTVRESTARRDRVLNFLGQARTERP